MTREEYIVYSIEKVQLSKKRYFIWGITKASVFLANYLLKNSVDVIYFLDNNKDKVYRYNKLADLPRKFNQDCMSYYSYETRIIAYTPQEVLDDCLDEIEDIDIITISNHYKDMKIQIEESNKNFNLIKIADMEKYNELGLSSHNRIKQLLGKRYKDFCFFCIKDTIQRMKDNGFICKYYNNCEDEIIFSKQDTALWIDCLYYGTFREIYETQIYGVLDQYVRGNIKYVVYDIGANRGYASLWFANKEWCSKVISYELIPQNCSKMEENLKLNEKVDITLNHYGLGKEDCIQEAYYFPFRDAICSTNKEFINSFSPMQINEAETIKVNIKRASEELKRYIMRDEHIILKIDVEGAEYDILDDISENYPEFYEQVDIIIGDAHMGLDKISEKLCKYKFKLVKSYYTKEAIAPFLYIKEDR